MNNECNVTTGEVRFSYAHLTKPYAAMPDQDEKYSVTVLVPKTDTATMGRINAAIEAAKQRGIQEKWNGQCPPVVQTPVHDGDGVRPSDGMPFGDECKGHWVFTASTKPDFPVEIVDGHGNPIMKPSEIYSGMYGRVNVTFFPYSYGGKKGIGCGLGPVQKLRDGEPLGGSSISAAQAFGMPEQTQPNQQPGYGGYQQQAQPGYGGYQQQAQPGYGGYQQQATAPQGQQPAYNVDPITGIPY